MANKKQTKTIMKKVQQAFVPVSLDDVQNKIIVLRGEPVILDRDVAKLYGVETREINQAVKNNPNKFPAGYTYSLTNQEVAEMRSKFLTTPSESTELHTQSLDWVVEDTIETLNNWEKEQKEYAR